VRLLHAGKVRDVYEAGPDRLLLVASDRISAFDVVLPEPVPDKGRVLTATTAFWFEHLHDVANHLLAVSAPEVPGRARGAGDAGAAVPHAPGGVRRAGVPGRVGVEGVRRPRHGARRRPAERAPGGRPAPRAALHPHHQGTGGGARRADHLRRRGGHGGSGAGRGGPGPVARGVPADADPRRGRAGSCWPTPSSSWASRSTATPTGPWCWPTRWGRPTPPGSGSVPSGTGADPAGLRQAAGPRLAGGLRVGQAAARAAPAGGGGGGHPAAVRGGLRAALRASPHQWPGGAPQ
jgi:hypothetical protein